MVYSTTISTPRMKVNVYIQANMLVLMLCLVLLIVRMLIPLWMVVKGAGRRRREIRDARMARVDGVEILGRVGAGERGRGWLMGDW
jgi:hypothetical protein